MQTFLDETAKTLLQNHQTELAQICVVLPSRRAGVFLKKSLSKIAAKTIWSPEIFSIEDFLTKISGFQKTDNVALTFELYEIHREIEKQNARDFEQFSKWGQVMLADFNEIDMHLIDAKNLYSYLSEVKALEKWNPDGRPLTISELDYLAFFNSLHHYYQHLHKKLKNRKQGYQGLIYRHAAENVEELTKGFSWEKIYFAGFNALTLSEEKVIEYLREQKHAVMLRDADAYYIDDIKQEAGEFLRRQLNHEGREKFGEIKTFLKDTEKKIKIHGIPKKEGQAERAGQILHEMYKTAGNESEKKMEDVAVVLADEGLMVPVLNALPESIQSFNITMGYPLRLTPPFTLVMLLLRMYENSLRFARMQKESGGGFYFKDLLRVLQHHMISGQYDISVPVQKIKALRQVMYQSVEILEFFKNRDSEKIAQIIFNNPNPTPQQLIEIINQLIGHFKEENQRKGNYKNQDKNATIQLEYLYYLAIINKRVSELNQQYQSIISLKTLRDIYRQLSQTSKLPFTGEPLKGLQIMGMLETRNLDFKRVILISANEGTLPASTVGNSLIPYDIQVETKMPTHHQKNAVFAYHFYRLLQQSEEVHIIYNTEADELGGGEKSRFVQQIMSELPKYNPKIKISETIESLPPPEALNEKVIEIPKTDAIYESLLQRSAKGLSATSLNQFRRCSLQFYLRQVAGLKEQDEAEESLEFKTIGSIVHQILEDLLTPFIGRQISSDEIEALKLKVDDYMQLAFKKHYSHGQVRFGKNRLIYEVIKAFVINFLNFEKEHIVGIQKDKGQLTIIGLEQKLSSENLSYLFPGLSDAEIKLIGVIDRLDVMNDTIRIIDYKTGRVKNKSELQLPEWEKLDEGHKHDKTFQVLLYAWLYSRMQPTSGKSITTGVISLPLLSNGLMNFGLKAHPRAQPDELIDDEKLESFEQYLMQLLEKIFNRDEPFVQTENTDTCRNCDFKSICGR